MPHFVQGNMKFISFLKIKLQVFFLNPHQTCTAALFSFEIYAPSTVVEKTPAATTIAKAASLSRGELLTDMVIPLGDEWLMVNG